jgi:hypothetical protein
MKLLSEVRVRVSELVDELEARGIHVDRVLLFGSLARGDFTLESDVDLIIVSRSWRAMGMVERTSLLYRCWRGGDATLVPLTPEELEAMKQRVGAIADASRYWIQLYP